MNVSRPSIILWSPRIFRAFRLSWYLLIPQMYTICIQLRYTHVIIDNALGTKFSEMCFVLLYKSSCSTSAFESFQRTWIGPAPFNKLLGYSFPVLRHFTPCDMYYLQFTQHDFDSVIDLKICFTILQKIPEAGLVCQIFPKHSYSICSWF